MAPTLQAAGFKPELGIDRHFFDRAKDSGMKRQALETMAFQLDQFDSLSPKLQEELLKSTMEDLDTEVSGVKEMAQAWAFGNVAAIEKLTLDRAAGGAGAVSAAARRAQSATGFRTSRRASSRTPAASSSSARPTSSGRTACRPCSARRATRSLSSRACAALADTVGSGANGRLDASASLEIRPESRDSWHPA